MKVAPHRVLVVQDLEHLDSLLDLLLLLLSLLRCS